MSDEKLESCFDSTKLAFSSNDETSYYFFDVSLQSLSHDDQVSEVPSYQLVSNTMKSTHMVDNSLARDAKPLAQLMMSGLMCQNSGWQKEQMVLGTDYRLLDLIPNILISNRCWLHCQAIVTDACFITEYLYFFGSEALLQLYQMALMGLSCEQTFSQELYEIYRFSLFLQMWLSSRDHTDANLFLSAMKDSSDAEVRRAAVEFLLRVHKAISCLEQYFIDSSIRSASKNSSEIILLFWTLEEFAKRNSACCLTRPWKNRVLSVLAVCKNVFFQSSSISQNPLPNESFQEQELILSYAQDRPRFNHANSQIHFLRQILNEVSDKGDVIWLNGKSGSGRTTLIAELTRLLKELKPEIKCVTFSKLPWHSAIHLIQHLSENFEQRERKFDIKSLSDAMMNCSRSVIILDEVSDKELDLVLSLTKSKHSVIFTNAGNETNCSQRMIQDRSVSVMNVPPLSHSDAREIILESLRQLPERFDMKEEEISQLIESEDATLPLYLVYAVRLLYLRSKHSLTLAVPTLPGTLQEIVSHPEHGILASLEVVHGRNSVEKFVEWSCFVDFSLELPFLVKLCKHSFSASEFDNSGRILEILPMIKSFSLFLNGPCMCGLQMHFNFPEVLLEACVQKYEMRKLSIRSKISAVLAAQFQIEIESDINIIRSLMSFCDGLCANPALTTVHTSLALDQSLQKESSTFTQKVSDSASGALIAFERLNEIRKSLQIYHELEQCRDVARIKFLISQYKLQCSTPRLEYLESIIKFEESLDQETDFVQINDLVHKMDGFSGSAILDRCIECLSCLEKIESETDIMLLKQHSDKCQQITGHSKLDQVRELISIEATLPYESNFEILTQKVELCRSLKGSLSLKHAESTLAAEHELRAATDLGRIQELLRTCENLDGSKWIARARNALSALRDLVTERNATVARALVRTCEFISGCPLLDQRKALLRNIEEAYSNIAETLCKTHNLSAENVQVEYDSVQDKPLTSSSFAQAQTAASNQAKHGFDQHEPQVFLSASRYLSPNNEDFARHQQNNLEFDPTAITGGCFSLEEQWMRLNCFSRLLTENDSGWLRSTFLQHAEWLDRLVDVVPAIHWKRKCVTALVEVEEMLQSSSEPTISLNKRRLLDLVQRCGDLTGSEKLQEVKKILSAEQSLATETRLSELEGAANLCGTLTGSPAVERSRALLAYVGELAEIISGHRRANLCEVENSIIKCGEITGSTFLDAAKVAVACERLLRPERRSPYIRVLLEACWFVSESPAIVQAKEWMASEEKLSQETDSQIHVDALLVRKMISDQLRLLYEDYPEQDLEKMFDNSFPSCNLKHRVLSLEIDDVDRLTSHVLRCSGLDSSVIRDASEVIGALLTLPNVKDCDEARKISCAVRALTDFKTVQADLFLPLQDKNGTIGRDTARNFFKQSKVSEIQLCSDELWSLYDTGNTGRLFLSEFSMLIRSLIYGIKWFNSTDIKDLNTALARCWHIKAGPRSEAVQVVQGWLAAEGLLQQGIVTGIYGYHELLQVIALCGPVRNSSTLALVEMKTSALRELDDTNHISQVRKLLDICFDMGDYPAVARKHLWIQSEKRLIALGYEGPSANWISCSQIELHRLVEQCGALQGSLALSNAAFVLQSEMDLAQANQSYDIRKILKVCGHLTESSYISEKQQWRRAESRLRETTDVAQLKDICDSCQDLSGSVILETVRRLLSIEENLDALNAKEELETALTALEGRLSGSSKLYNAMKRYDKFLILEEFLASIRSNVHIHDLRQSVFALCLFAVFDSLDCDGFCWLEIYDLASACEICGVGSEVESAVAVQQLFNSENQALLIYFHASYHRSDRHMSLNPISIHASADTLGIPLSFEMFEDIMEMKSHEYKIYFREFLTFFLSRLQTDNVSAQKLFSRLQEGTELEGQKDMAQACKWLSAEEELQFQLSDIIRLEAVIERCGPLRGSARLDRAKETMSLVKRVQEEKDLDSVRNMLATCSFYRNPLLDEVRRLLELDDNLLHTKALSSVQNLLFALQRYTSKNILCARKNLSLHDSIVPLLVMQDSVPSQELLEILEIVKQEIEQSCDLLAAQAFVERSKFRSISFGLTQNLLSVSIETLMAIVEKLSEDPTLEHSRALTAMGEKLISALQLGDTMVQPSASDQIILQELQSSGTKLASNFGLMKGGNLCPATSVILLSGKILHSWKSRIWSFLQYRDLMVDPKIIQSYLGVCFDEENYNACVQVFCNFNYIRLQVCNAGLPALLQDFQELISKVQSSAFASQDFVDTLDAYLRFLRYCSTKGILASFCSCMNCCVRPASNIVDAIPELVRRDVDDLIQSWKETILDLEMLAARINNYTRYCDFNTVSRDTVLYLNNLRKLRIACLFGLETLMEAEWIERRKPHLFSITTIQARFEILFQSSNQSIGGLFQLLIDHLHDMDLSIQVGDAFDIFIELSWKILDMDRFVADVSSSKSSAGTKAQPNAGSQKIQSPESLESAIRTESIVSIEEMNDYDCFRMSYSYPQLVQIIEHPLIPSDIQNKSMLISVHFYTSTDMPIGRQDFLESHVCPALGSRCAVSGIVVTFLWHVREHSGDLQETVALGRKGEIHIAVLSGTTPTASVACSSTEREGSKSVNGQDFSTIKFGVEVFMKVWTKIRGMSRNLIPGVQHGHTEQQHTFARIEGGTQSQVLKTIVDRIENRRKLTILGGHSGSGRTTILHNLSAILRENDPTMPFAAFFRKPWYSEAHFCRHLAAALEMDAKGAGLDFDAENFHRLLSVSHHRVILLDSLSIKEQNLVMSVLEKYEHVRDISVIMTADIWACTRYCDLSQVITVLPLTCEERTAVCDKIITRLQSKMLFSKESVMRLIEKDDAELPQYLVCGLQFLDLQAVTHRSTQILTAIEDLPNTLCKLLSDKGQGIFAFLDRLHGHSMVSTIFQALVSFPVAVTFLDLMEILTLKDPNGKFFERRAVQQALSHVLTFVTMNEYANGDLCYSIENKALRTAVSAAYSIALHKSMLVKASALSEIELLLQDVRDVRNLQILLEATGRLPQNKFKRELRLHLTSINQLPFERNFVNFLNIVRDCERLVGSSVLETGRKSITAAIALEDEIEISSVRRLFTQYKICAVNPSIERAHEILSLERRLGTEPENSYEKLVRIFEKTSRYMGSPVFDRLSDALSKEILLRTSKDVRTLRECLCVCCFLEGSQYVEDAKEKLKACEQIWLRTHISKDLVQIYCSSIEDFDLQAFCRDLFVPDSTSSAYFTWHHPAWMRAPPALEELQNFGEVMRRKFEKWCLCYEQVCSGLRAVMHDLHSSVPLEEDDYSILSQMLTLCKDVNDERIQRLRNALTAIQELQKSMGILSEEKLQQKLMICSSIQNCKVLDMIKARMSAQDNLLREMRVPEIRKLLKQCRHLSASKGVQRARNVLGIIRNLSQQLVRIDEKDFKLSGTYLKMIISKCKGLNGSTALDIARSWGLAIARLEMREYNMEWTGLMKESGLNPSFEEEEKRLDLAFVSESLQICKAVTGVPILRRMREWYQNVSELSSLIENGIDCEAKKLFDFSQACGLLHGRSTLTKALSTLGDNSTILATLSYFKEQHVDATCHVKWYDLQKLIQHNDQLDSCTKKLCTFSISIERAQSCISALNLFECGHISSGSAEVREMIGICEKIKSFTPLEEIKKKMHLLEEELPRCRDAKRLNYLVEMCAGIQDPLLTVAHEMLDAESQLTKSVDRDEIVRLLAVADIRGSEVVDRAKNWLRFEMQVKNATNYTELKELLNLCGNLQNSLIIDTKREIIRMCDQIAAERDLGNLRTMCTFLEDKVTECIPLDNARRILDIERSLPNITSFFELHYALSMLEDQFSCCEAVSKGNSNLRKMLENQWPEISICKSLSCLRRFVYIAQELQSSSSHCSPDTGQEAFFMQREFVAAVDSARVKINAVELLSNTSDYVSMMELLKECGDLQECDDVSRCVSCIQAIDQLAIRCSPPELAEIIKKCGSVSGSPALDTACVSLKLYGLLEDFLQKPDRIPIQVLKDCVEKCANLECVNMEIARRALISYECLINLRNIDFLQDFSMDWGVLTGVTAVETIQNISKQQNLIEKENNILKLKDLRHCLEGLKGNVRRLEKQVKRFGDSNQCVHFQSKNCLDEIEKDFDTLANRAQSARIVEDFPELRKAERILRYFVANGPDLKIGRLISSHFEAYWCVLNCSGYLHSGKVIEAEDLIPSIATFEQLTDLLHVCSGFESSHLADARRILVAVDMAQHHRRFCEVLKIKKLELLPENIRKKVFAIQELQSCKNIDRVNALFPLVSDVILETGLENVRNVRQLMAQLTATRDCGEAQIILGDVQKLGFSGMEIEEIKGLLELEDSLPQLASISALAEAVNLLQIRFDNSSNMKDALHRRQALPTFPGDIFSACDSDDTESIIRFMHKGVSPNSRNKSGQTLIYHACNTGKLSIAQFLVAERADVLYCNADGSTPLHAAAQKGSKEIAQWLLQCSKKLICMATNHTQLTPLHLASTFGRRNIVKLLLESLADQEMRDRQGNTAIMLAIKTNQVEVAQIFLSSEKALPGLYNCNNDQYSCIHLAAQAGLQEVVEYCFQHHIDPGEKTSRGYTALHLAAGGGHVDLCRWLVKMASIDINVRDTSGNTPLHHAARACRQDVVEALLEDGADRRLVNYEGRGYTYWETPVDSRYVHRWKRNLQLRAPIPSEEAETEKESSGLPSEGSWEWPLIEGDSEEKE